MKPIHEAAQSGDIKEISKQLQLGISVDCTAQDDSTPLHIAILYEQDLAVRLLLEKNASVNAKNELGLTPLHIAAKQGLDLMTCLLIEASANPNSRDITNRTPLHYAAYGNHSTICDFLCKSGAELCIFDENNYTPLHCASEQGADESICVLLDHFNKADVQIKDGWSPLHIATQYEHSKTVDLLINNGATIDLKSFNGSTALHIAAQLETPEMMKFLIDRSANINAQDDDGDTPLFLSIQQNLFENVKCLVDSGASLSIKNKKGMTALLYACKYNTTDIALYLLDIEGEQVKVSDFDYQKNTSLHFAAMQKNPELVNALIMHKADPLYRNIFGKSPFSLSTPETIQVFKSSLEKIREVRYSTSRSHSRFLVATGANSSDLTTVEEEREFEPRPEINETNSPLAPKDYFQEDNSIEDSALSNESNSILRKPGSIGIRQDSSKARMNPEKLPKQTQLEYEALKKSVDEELTEIRSEFNHQIDVLVKIIKELRAKIAKNKMEKDDQ